MSIAFFNNIIIFYTLHYKNPLKNIPVRCYLVWIISKEQLFIRHVSWIGITKFKCAVCFNKEIYKYGASSLY